MLSYSASPVAGTFCFDDVMLLITSVARQCPVTKMATLHRHFGKMAEREDDDEKDPDHPASTRC